MSDGITTMLPVFMSVMAAIAAVAGVVAVAWPGLSGRDPLDRRIAEVSRGLRTADPAGDGTDQRSSQKRSVRETLMEVDEVRKSRSRRVLIRRLREAGLGWSKRQYYALSVALALAGGGVALAFGGGMLVLAGLPIAFGVGLPQLFLAVRRKRRVKAISLDFPNAVDIIVRGVKSGLPLTDCLRIVATEAREPLRSEFARIIDDLQIGLPMIDAVHRFAERVPISEANFLAIVVAIQSQTGGNLSDSLQNLSNVLRERHKMAAKVQAMSSEAKASAGIIGALPIVVTGIVYLTSPDYISVLFTETTGNIIILCSAIWMSIGVMMMSKMINFNF